MVEARRMTALRKQVIVKEELLSGGMATLTRALRTDDTLVLIRELQPKNLFKLRLHCGFVRGTKIRQRLSGHRHIVRSFERGHWGLLPYEIIEFIDGSNLRTLIQKKNTRVHEYAVEILQQVAGALAHMHSAGILHLDIKAENVMVDLGAEGGATAKLTDFDLSRYVTSRYDRHRSGTAAYMAPEHWRHGRIGPAADIFAFGVMAYDLLTGRMPFQGVTETMMRKKQLKGSAAIAPPSEFNDGVTPKQDAAIMRCLEKNPDDRFPSIAYLCKEL